MCIRYIETFFYILISQSHNVIYFGMILSMWQNAGIISVFYPVSIFGYALLEETRPRIEYWELVRKYTIVVLFFKFIMNIDSFGAFVQGKTFIYYESLLKVGIYDYENLYTLFFYMIPEILIITFIMLNEIKLKLIGLYYKREHEVETILDGIQRNLLEGDEEKMKQKKIEATNMQMEIYFESVKEQ
jgi:hypothetical protein